MTKEDMKMGKFYLIVDDSSDGEGMRLVNHRWVMKLTKGWILAFENEKETINPENTEVYWNVTGIYIPDENHENDWEFAE